MERTVKISKDHLCRLGSGSLVGTAIANGILPPGPIHVLFEASSQEFLRENGGPDEVIMPEYVPMCLCRDILSLIKLGYEVFIDEYHD